MSRRGVSRQGNWGVFRWPMLIGAVSVVGLISALVGDGWYDMLSWAALGGTVVVMIAAWRGWSAR